MKRARGVARANANDGPFAVEEARGTLVTLAREIKRETTTAARDDERGGARETRRAIEAIEKRDEEEEEEEKTKWTTFGVRADDGSTARLSYAFSNVVDGASTTLALKMDAVDARGERRERFVVALGRARGRWRRVVFAAGDVGARAGGIARAGWEIVRVGVSRERRRRADARVGAGNERRGRARGHVFAAHE